MPGPANQGVGEKQRFQIGLRTLLLLIGIAGILIGWYADHQRLRREIADLQGPGEVRIFSLVNVKAADVVVTLQTLMPKQLENKSVNLGVDRNKNAVLASGNPNTLAVIEAILLKLDATAADSAKGVNEDLENN